MTRKQIKPENNYPLSTMDEREVLNPDSQEAGSRPASVVVANNSPAHEKKKIYEADNDDEEPVKDLLVYYAQNSTMHGVPSIVGSELYRGRHIFWMFVVCVMALFLGTVIYWQMSDYYNYPTVTSVDISYVTENDFPSVTFCDQNIMNRNEVKGLKDDLTAFYLAELTEITGIYMNQVRPIKKKMQKPAATNRSSSELVGNYLRDSLIRFKIAMSKPENQPVCSWGDYYWTPCPFVSFRVTQMGLCGTLNVRDLPRNRSDNSTEDTAVSNAMRGLTILLDVPSLEIPFRFNHIDGMKIVLHEPDEEPLPLSSGFLVPGNTTLEVEISKSLKHGLPPPYKAFGGSTCVDTGGGSFKNPLTRFNRYTKEACETECFMSFVVEVCGGCRHFLHPGNESICEMEHLTDCYEIAQRQYYGGADKKKCSCPLPCVQAHYKSSVTTSSFRQTQHFIELKQKHNVKVDQNLAYIHIFFADPVVTTMRQVAIYSAEGLLGSIGGQIGLFMGFSLVTVAEMLELIFLLATRGRKLDEHVKRHRETEAAVQAAIQANA